jgi:uncharacterized SAM-binding protein YcdF (DUF218 family)
MRATLTEVVHLLMQVPLWVFIGLIAAAIWAWRRPGTRAFRWRYALVAAAAVYYAATIPYGIGLVREALEKQYPVPRVGQAERDPDGVILVLTSGWLRRTPDGYEQKLGEAGWIRTWEAVHLWRRVGGRILFTGAPHPEADGSAAGRMAEVAAQLGVPREALLVEPHALNTRENMLFAKRMIGPRARRVWLVTSAFHMPRSVAAARGVGLEVIPYPCDFRVNEGFDWTDFFPSNSARGSIEDSLHELLGLASYRLRGWAP